MSKMTWVIFGDSSLGIVVMETIEKTVKRSEKKWTVLTTEEAEQVRGQFSRRRRRSKTGEDKCQCPIAKW